MAYPPNGPQRYYSLSNNQAQVPPPPPLPPPPEGYASPYASPPNLTSQPTQIPLRRTSSFDPGDDANFFGDSGQQAQVQPAGNASHGGQAGHGGGYVGSAAGTITGGAPNNLGSRRSQFSVGSSQRSTVSPVPSMASSAMSGYQHQYQPPSTSPNQPAYNPQQFVQQPPVPVQPQSGYNPQSFAPTATSQYSSQAYQHYNPAAYHSPTRTSYQTSPGLQWQPSISGPHYAQPTPPQSQNPYSAYSSPRYSDSASHAQQSYFSSAIRPTGSAPVSSIATPFASLSPPLPPTSSYGADAYTTDTSSRPAPSRHYSQTSPYTPYTPSPPPHTSLPPEPSPEPPAHAPVDDRLSFASRAGRLSISSTTMPTPPPHQDTPSSPPRRTDTLTRHPQSRPLPGPPSETSPGSGSAAEGRNGGEGAEPAFDEIMKEVEAAVMEGRPSVARRQSSPIHHQPVQGAEEPAPLKTPSPHMHLSPDEQETHTNGHGNISSTGTGQYVNYDAYSDDSDAEAAAGLAALQMAEEEDAAYRARRGTNASFMSAYVPPYPERTQAPAAAAPTPAPTLPTRLESSSDSDYAHYDMGLYGGGYDAQMHYGDIPSFGAGTDRIAATSGSFRSSDTDGKAPRSDIYEYPPIDQDSIHPFPALGSAARVDAVGTGGLSEPSPLRRRMSFDDGDDGPLGDSDTHTSSVSETPDEGEPQDLFFHPGMTSRPLPPPPVQTLPSNVIPHLMPAGTYRSRDQASRQYEPYRRPSFPTSPETFSQSHLAPSTVPRSSSISNHTTAPRTDPIIRSKTDADRLKLKHAGYESSIQSPSVAPLDLPTIPAGRRKKFNPAKLSSEQFNRCTEPWALSSIVAWVKDLSEDETDLKEQAIVDAIVALFTHKVPTMNTADAETLGERVVKGMLEEGALIQDEEWVKFGTLTLSGVLYQITGQGCYSSRLHLQETEISGRCYSHHCMRTLKKINLQAQMMEPQKKAEDWATFYKVGKEVFETHSKKEIDRQNILHEIVTTEDSYIEQLDILQKLYRDQLASIRPPVIHPKQVDRFLRDVFGNVDAVKKVNEDHLLAQLKYCQREQGPFIVGFSDIFREWIRKAKATYIDYAATFPNANYLVRREEEMNPLFRSFLKQARENKLSQRLSWDTFLKAPITRIQRYILLLTTVHKHMEKDSEEKSNLNQAIEEIKLVAVECDNKVGEMTKKANLREVGSRLQFRPELKRSVELNLEHLGREIIFQGDLQRPRTKGFNWVDTRVILFDHYLVLAKVVTTRESARTIKQIFYEVSKLPIPMYLLILESTNDDPVIRSSVKGITTVAAPANKATAPGGDVRAGGSGTLNHVNTNTSISSAATSNSGKTIIPATVLENAKDDKILYPFKIKHLGQQDVYTLYAPTAQNRQDWCDKITEAKTKHAASLYAQNAEPFRLRVLADSAFAHSDQTVGTKSVVVRGTPLDRAIREVEKKFEPSLSRPLPVCRASVNCATVFHQPYGRLMCAIGTDYGVYISEYNNPRGWNKAITLVRVTQVAVFEEFNLFLLIADKSLIAYHLDVVCPVSGIPAQNDSPRRAPQKLSGNREVGFFAAGRMKDRALVFYKKREGINSNFKVLEPVLQKSTATRSRFMSMSRRGQTDFFRDFDEFYIPAECYSINLFHSSLAIATSKGTEILTLDKKLPWSIPNLQAEEPDAQAYLTSIANRIKDLRPLGMFRISESEFLVAYQECAVYVNKHGDVSRSVVMEFVGRAHSACLCGKFLILCNDDFVEVRNAMNGRLRQVIAGRNVTLLDDGGNGAAGGGASTSNTPAGTTHFTDAPAAALGGGPNGLGLSTSFGATARTVKICMQHPEQERIQLVLELVENEGQKD